MKTIIKIIKPHYKLYAALALLVPVFLSIAVIGKILLSEVNQAYSERLEAGLSTFEVLIDQKLSVIQRELSRISDDDALKVTLALDMYAQLGHYLKEEFEGSGLDFMQIFTVSDEQKLAEVESTAGVAPTSSVCNEDYRVLVADAGKVFLKLQFPVNREGETLAILCGGIELGSKQSMAYLRETLGADPFLIDENGGLLLHNDPQFALPLDLASKTLFSPENVSTSSFAMTDQYMVEGPDFGFGLTIQKFQVHDHAIKVLQVLVIVLLLIMSAVYFALRNYRLQQRTKKDLQKVNELASVTLSSIGDGVITTDANGWVKYMNTAAVGLTGCSIEQMQGKPWNQRIKLVETRTANHMDPVMASISLKRTMRSTVDTNLVSQKGKSAVQYIVAPIFEQQAVSGAVVILHDNSRERELRETLLEQVNTDQLTGLMNRGAFCSLVASALKNISFSDNQHAVLFLDLDRFKVVNDACGHQAGDLLLRQVGTIFNRVLRGGDSLARLGGDEFGIFLTDTTPEKVLIIAEKLLTEINNFRFIHAGKPFSIGVSIGATMMDTNSRDSESVFKQADTACFVAKEQGRNRVEMFQPDANAKAVKPEVDWIPRIRDALRNDRMFLYVQPIRPTSGKHFRQSGIFEVLIRMLDDNMDVVLPGAFLPVADRYGLMPEIDRWVIESVFKDDVMSSITKAGVRDDTLSLISFNISSASISQPEFLTFVIDKLTEYEVCPANICFELSETTISAHLAEADYFISELSALGCRFMIDDVGVGMSSFSHFKHLKIDFLKIDSSAIKNTETDPVDRSLVKAAIDIAQAMEMMVVAEFVETEEIAKSLSRLGVDYLQGYAVGTPYPIEDFRQRILHIAA